MPKLSQMQIAGILLLVVLILGAFLFGLPAKLFKGSWSKPVQQQTQTASPVLSLAGKIESVDVKTDSFKVSNTQDRKTYTVKLGQDTKIVQLIFPFDLKNPPPNKTFTPERKSVTLQDLKAGDQIFLRASQPVKEGQDVANPIEIQILP